VRVSNDVTTFISFGVVFDGVTYVVLSSLFGLCEVFHVLVGRLLVTSQPSLRVG
jgi:hypothetical protein